MKINTKCSLALHILLFISVSSEQMKMTSESVAKSTGSNPVIIRNILGDLKKAGIVTVRRGSGGAELSMLPSEISIWHVYNAVEPASLDKLIGLHSNPALDCSVGSRIHKLLEEPYGGIRQSVKAYMQSYTLADLLVKYREETQESFDWHPSQGNI